MTPSSQILCVFIALLSAACVQESEGESAVVIAQTLSFGARNGEMMDGRDVSVGIDLDAYDTQEREVGRCFVRDFVSPDGRVGIDNTFTNLFELVEGVFQEGTIAGIIQGTINEGRLLLMLEVTGVDDWQNDDEVTLTVFLGEGRPNIGGDGFLLASQTFDRRVDAERVSVRARITDGVLETDPFELSMPLAFFNVFFELRLHDARVRATLGNHGEWEGVIAGGMDAEDVMDVARQADMMQELQISDSLAVLLPAWADLHYDEESRQCDQLSATLVFRTTQAFVFDDTVGE